MIEIAKEIVGGFDIAWKEIKGAEFDPEEAEFVLVASFDTYGKLQDYSEDYVIFAGGISYNGSGKHVKQPTHYIRKSKFNSILQAIPREEGQNILL